MAYWITGIVVAAILVLAPIMGYLSSPWAGFWLAGKKQIPPPIVVDGDAAPLLPPADPGNLNPIMGAVSDAQRFQLARLAGWTVQDAITATAISIAENGTGNPAALSGVNFNNTRDLGLYQINSIWWDRFGGHHALIDPWRNTQAAYYIKGRQGWCAWSTYLASCGPGHTGSFSAFIGRATAASLVQLPPGQA